MLEKGKFNHNELYGPIYRLTHASNNSTVTIDSTLLHELETSCRANCGLEPLSTISHKMIYDHCSLSDCHGNSFAQDTSTALTSNLADDGSYRMVHSSSQGSFTSN